MKYTLIFLFNETLDKVLLMLKDRGPYIGCLNGVGGKIEGIESPYDGALREMEEETGAQTDLKLLVRCDYPSGTELNVYYAAVRQNQVRQIESETLMWIPVKDVINNTNIQSPLAGEGNVQYFVNASSIALRDNTRAV